MTFNDKFAVLLFIGAIFVTALHAMRVPIASATGIQLVQVFVVPEVVLGALWGSGVVLAVQFYFRKAPSADTVTAMSSTNNSSSASVSPAPSAPSDKAA